MRLKSNDAKQLFISNILFNNLSLSLLMSDLKIFGEIKQHSYL